MEKITAELYEALVAMLDIAPFARDPQTKEIHVQAANAICRYRQQQLERQVDGMDMVIYGLVTGDYPWAVGAAIPSATFKEEE